MLTYDLIPLYNYFFLITFVAYVIKGITGFGNTLDYADDSLKKDKEIVLKAVKQDNRALKYADKSLKNDMEILRAVNE